MNEDDIGREVERYRGELRRIAKIDSLLDVAMAKHSWTDDELDALGKLIVTEKKRYGYSKESFRENARHTLSQGYSRDRVWKRLRANLSPGVGTWPWGF